jgi:hypothetical protein
LLSNEQVLAPGAARASKQNEINKLLISEYKMVKLMPRILAITESSS